jgi:serine kinase of HPr protein (carbohydrate metabolism regulator)
MKGLILGDLISGFEKKLEIFCTCGKKGLKRELGYPTVQRFDSGISLIAGSLLILDPEALSHLMHMTRHEFQAFLDRLIDLKIQFISTSNLGEPPEDLRTFADTHDIVLCVSRHDAYLLESRLMAMILEKLVGVKTLHANLVVINDKGVLLTGDSGCGKTCCCVSLVRQGQQWVADDTVVLEKRTSSSIVGRAHMATKGLLHLRDRGIMPVEEWIRAVSIRDEAMIDLIVELDGSENGPSLQEPTWSVREIMGVPIRCTKISRGSHVEITSSKLLQYCL